MKNSKDLTKVTFKDFYRFFLLFLTEEEIAESLHKRLTVTVKVILFLFVMLEAQYLSLLTFTGTGRESDACLLSLICIPIVWYCSKNPAYSVLKALGTVSGQVKLMGLVAGLGLIKLTLVPGAPDAGIDYLHAYLFLCHAIVPGSLYLAVLMRDEYRPKAMKEFKNIQERSKRATEESAL